MAHIKELLESLKFLNLEGAIVDKKAQAQGFGGSSDVFSAWSRKHEKNVAVKQLRAHLKFDPKFTKRLTRELRIWADLKDPNVLPFLGFFVDGGDIAPSLISEWMANGTLFNFMRTIPRGGIIARIILRGVASGLHYLHSHNVIHADLKSANIFISNIGAPLVADFGLSLAVSQSRSMLTTHPGVKGTVRWMAIELLSSEGDEPSRDEKTDVWAFGMVIYEMLSWDIPYWESTNDFRVANNIIDGKLPTKPLTDEGSFLNIFDNLWELAGSCWSREAACRPNALQLMDHLSRTIEPFIIERSSFKRQRLWRKFIYVCIAASKFSCAGKGQLAHVPFRGEIGDAEDFEQRTMDGLIIGRERLSDSGAALAEDRAARTKQFEVMIVGVSQYITNARFSFKEVGQKIDEVGFTNIVSSHLISEWSKVSKNFKDILRNSANSAVQGHRTISEFLSVVLPRLQLLTERDEEAILKALELYNETLSIGRKFAANISETYRDIVNQVSMFRLTCSGAMVDFKKVHSRAISGKRATLALDIEQTKPEVNTPVNYRERVMNGVFRILPNWAPGSSRTKSTVAAVTLETANKEHKDIDNLADNAEKEIESLSKIWEMFYQEICGIEAKITLFIEGRKSWMTHNNFYQHLQMLSARCATLKNGFESYAKAAFDG